MRYHIWTEGCQMNEADSAKLAAGLARLGWQQAPKPDEADLAVVNTCVVRQKAEDKAIGYLGYLRKLKEGRDAPDSSADPRSQFRIAVMGCLVGPRTNELRARFPFVDIWAQPQNFDAILQALVPENDLGGEFWPETFPAPKGPTAFVPVIHGCNKFCTYCIVPYRRGRERSRTIADVAKEVVSHAAKGVREVILLGQTVEAYGKDLPQRPDLGDLFAAIHDTPGLRRIRFLTSYPKDMTEPIIRSVARLPKVCEHFNIPVQAGDNEILARMRRGYTIEEYLEWVYRIREMVPESTLSTDIIVGFCGETEAQFQKTLDLLEEVRFDKVHVAAYSPRPGTIAWRTLEDDVPPMEKRRRLHAVEEMQERIATQINQKLVGTLQEVLIEGENRKAGANGDAPLLSGRTRSNKLVHFSGKGLLGDLINVRIDKASPWSLQGMQLRKSSAH